MVTALKSRDELDCAGIERLIEHILEGGVLAPPYYFPAGPEGSPDSFGVASPHVLSVPEKGRVYLFYAGRGHPRPGEAWNGHAVPGAPGYVSSHIMLASAEADAGGAPVGPFGERRLIVGLDAVWRNMRVDDPCAIVVLRLPEPLAALACGQDQADDCLKQWLYRLEIS